MKIEMYQDAAGEWRWRLRTPNGRTVADSAEGYATKPGVRRAIASFVKYLSEAVPVEEVKVRAADVVDVPVKTKVSRPKATARKR